MAREFGKTRFSMFTDDDFCAQQRFDKLLYIVLLAQPSLNYAGVQPINLKRWRRALRDGDQMPTEIEVKASLIRLERRDYVFTDDDTGEAYTRTLMRNDGIDKQPNVMLSALRSAAAVESPKIARVMLAELDRIVLPEVKGTTDGAERLRKNLKALNAAARSHLETLSEGLPEPLPEPFAEDFPKGLPEGFTEPFPRPAETEPLSEGFPEGFGEGTVGVGVGVSNSPLVSGQVGEACARPAQTGQTAASTDSTGPPPNCPKHPNGTNRPCRDCADARHANDAWRAEQQRIESERRAAFLDEIADCPDCDELGWVDNGRNGVARCTAHDWQHAHA